MNSLHARFRITRANGRPEVEVTPGTGAAQLGAPLLAMPGLDPNVGFLHTLRTLLGDAGAVFMWSKHEHTVLKNLRDDLEAMTAHPNDKAEISAFIGTLLDGPRALYDFAKLTEQAFFHLATKARCSLSVVLPAVLSWSDWLRARYARPIYGAAGGIPSRNFRDFTRWQQAGGDAQDPYALLSDICADLPRSSMPRRKRTSSHWVVRSPRPTPGRRTRTSIPPCGKGSSVRSAATASWIRWRWRCWCRLGATGAGLRIGMTFARWPGPLQRDAFEFPPSRRWAVPLGHQGMPKRKPAPGSQIRRKQQQGDPLD